MKKLFALLVVSAAVCFTHAAAAQKLSHIPLKSVTVTLQKVAPNGKSDADSSQDRFGNNFLRATTDEDGKFMFGYMRPGVYALGCSYEECCTAFDNCVKHASSAQPSVQIWINACEGMYCRISSGKMTPADWMTCSVSPAQTAISRGWSNSQEWLKSGGGILLKVDGARSIVSGKIEAQPSSELMSKDNAR
jgi:hypothetical protein